MTIVRNLSDKKHFDVPILVVSLLLPVVTIYAMRNHIFNHHGGAGFGVFFIMASCIVSIVLALMLLEARSVRYWREKADRVTQTIASEAENMPPEKNMVVFQSWMNSWFIWGMAAIPLVAVKNPPSSHLLALMLVLWSLMCVFLGLVRTRWSPLGIPEVEITTTTIRVPAMFCFSSSPLSDRVPCSVVLEIPLDAITHVGWGAIGYHSAPLLIINTTQFTETHPLSKKASKTFSGESFTIRASLSSGTVTPDAIVTFAERLIEHAKDTKDEHTT